MQAAKIISLIFMLMPWLSTHAIETDQSFSAVIETRKQGPSPREINAPTQVIVLGTGTPIPDPHRAGSSIAVIHKGQAYLFDIGSGSVHRAVQARYQYDIPSLYPSQICCVFLTHLHNDHTLDFNNLAQTLWWRRTAKLRAWGPKGLNEMIAGLYQMMAPDIRIRTSGLQPVPNPGLYQVSSKEITSGSIYNENGLQIEAFDANHGDIKPAFSYKIIADDLSIVISGDTAYSQQLLEKAKGVDLLFHEVISNAGLARNTQFWQNYHRQAHTPADLVGKLAALAKPKKLILYHALHYGMPETKVIEEVRQHFDGTILLANDLDRFSSD